MKTPDELRAHAMQYEKLMQYEADCYINCIDNWVKFHRVKDYKNADMWRALVHGWQRHLSICDAREYVLTGRYRWQNVFEAGDHYAWRMKVRKWDVSAVRTAR